MKRCLCLHAAVAASLCLAALPAAAQETKPWIHVHVTEGGDSPKNIRVNLPLSVVGVALEVAPEKIVEKGRVRLNNADISIADMRRLWATLRDSGDSEFVNVEDGGQHVSIVREAGLVLIKVDDRKDGREARVRVEIPVKVVDALFATEGEELDIAGALDRLQSERGDIVRVIDGDTNVRIWIDETASSS